MSRDEIENYVILGELSLDGSLRPIRGTLPIAIEISKIDTKGMVLPVENASEAAMAQNVKVYPVASLSEAVAFFNGELAIEPFGVSLEEVFSSICYYHIDFQDVKGQQQVKRALEVAAAGGHNIIMIGPPGSGKTMLTKRMPTILPDLTLAEALETTKIHSVAGLLPSHTPLIATRPFRSPHHTISDTGVMQWAAGVFC